jgi:RND family efflux transporter MFP subunit
MTDVETEPATAGEEPVWKRRRAQVGAALALLILIAAGWCWHSRGASPEEAAQPIVSVRLAKAEIGAIAQPLDVVGTISARQEATISPKVSAQIAQMGLLKNRVVHRGDILAVLESRDLSAQQAEAAAALREAQIGVASTSRGAIPLTNAQDTKAVHDAQATVENTRKTYERRKALFDQGGISKKDLEASLLDVTKAEDDLRLAERSASLHQGTTNPSDLAAARSKEQQAAGHLAALSAQAGYATIRAPFDGVISEQFLFQGDFASAGTKMLTIADTSSVIVKAPLSVDAAMNVRAGDTATIQPDTMPGVTLQGTVNLVGRAADAQSRAVELWIALPNPNGTLQPNSAARVTINSSNVPNAIVVPTSAVTLDATNANAGTVMVVDAKSVAHEVKVTTGAHTRQRTQITSGLHGGETVVIEGNYGLPDGTKVQNADIAPTPPAAAAPEKD